MASEREESVPRAGLRNTLRFLWRRAEGAMMSREAFGRQVLMGALKQTVAEVLCFQSNSLEQSFEITFCTSEACREVLEECRRQGALKPVSSFEYAEVLTEARRVRDTLGFWTGKRQYQVLFKPVPEGVEGFEGFLHPPARFSIGADRGYLFYSRQPPYGGGGKARGHTEEGGGAKKCRRCGVVGHEVKNCPVPKACYGCGETGHLAKTCPKARPVSGPAGQGEHPKDGKERQEEVPPGCGKASGGGKVPAAGGKSGVWVAPWSTEGGFNLTMEDGARPFAFGTGVPKGNQGMLTTAAMKALESLTGVLASSVYVPTGGTAMSKFMAGKGDDIKRAAAATPKNRHAIRVEGLKGVRRKVVSPVLKPGRREEDPPAEKMAAGPSNLTEGGVTETVGEVPKQWGDCVMEGVEGPVEGAMSPEGVSTGTVGKVPGEEKRKVESSPSEKPERSEVSPPKPVEGGGTVRTMGDCWENPWGGGRD
ncbi:hypothetical protein SKAU_G00387060 [Synaphobranchus kaupii]|uniref:CCHC-type domain-containing protein n=1 Tax=Synaphobranchus kaupii TaxID=118154 RepID=A0A9Q1EAU2_SYNKA|nr:hypothetical protein SKAU_G00387060 [Synaphobranchus kaupii]